MRGLLCFKCNNALGDLGDSFEVLNRAVVYLMSDRQVDVVIQPRVLALAYDG